MFKAGGEPNDGLVGRIAAQPITTKRGRMLAEQGAKSAVPSWPRS